MRLTALLLLSLAMLKDVLTLAAISLTITILLILAYAKGREDEKYSKYYLCPDCGEFRDHPAEDLCRDCQRKLNGEMAQ